MSKVMRSVRNVTKGYSAVQVKVRNATSNDPWGPTGTDMSDIAHNTFDQHDFLEIMEMVDKRLNDKGKNWRHVLKALKVLDYCLHEGSENVVAWAKDNLYVIKTLREFMYVDEDGRDVGANIRTSAKELTSLLLDEERLRTERRDRKTWKSRVTGIEEFAPQSSEGSHAGPVRPTKKPNRGGRTEEEDLEYKLALEASMNQAEEDKVRNAKRASQVDDDDDLQKALRLSKEEEELRQKELSQSNADLLFDAADETPTPTQNQGSSYFPANQPYQQQPQVDWYGNTMQDPNAAFQQQQQTGYLQNAYSMQGQLPQQAGLDPNAIYMQQQYTANPYANTGFQTQSPVSQLAPLDNNPWTANNSSLKPAEPIVPAPTGSNNPFAQFGAFNQPQKPANTVPTLDSLRLQHQQNAFQQAQQTSFQPPQQTQQTQQPQSAFANYTVPSKPVAPQDPYKANLEALLSSGDGQDTFGNVGALRVPAHHTTGPAFVNSAGHNLNTQLTGNNPFLQQSMTGAPAFGGGVRPAATGPAGLNGFGGGFGQQPQAFGGYGGQQGGFGQQQQGRGQQSNNLIDL